MISGKSLPMPIKVRPYLHQQQAFDFACEKFGLFGEESGVMESTDSEKGRKKVMHMTPINECGRGCALLMEM